MIIHQYADGSEGYEYERGDEVVIRDVIAGSAWLRRTIGRPGTIGGMNPYNRASPSRHSMIMDVYDSPEWGPVTCFPWMVEPTPATKETAAVVAA